MNFDAGAVDEEPFGRILSACQRTENSLPYSALRPANEAIVERLFGPVDIGAVSPASAAFERMHDPAQNPSVIHALFTAHIVQQERFDPRPLRSTPPGAAALSMKVGR